MEIGKDMILADRPSTEGIEQFPVRLPITEIVNHLKMEQLQRMLRRIRKFYTEASQEDKKQYRMALGQFLSPNRDERRVIEKRLKKLLAAKLPGRALGNLKFFPDLIISVMSAEETIAEEALELWVDSEPELSSAVKDFLIKKSFPIEEAHLAHGFRGIFPEEITRIIGTFSLDHPETNQDDITLMFSCLTGYLPPKQLKPPRTDESTNLLLDDIPKREDVNGKKKVLTSEAQSMHDLAGTVWHDWLEQLTNLKAESSDWDVAHVFLDRLKTMIESKLEARTIDLTRVRYALEMLRSEFPAELRALDSENTLYAPHTDWTVGSFPFANAEDLITTIERLSSIFKERDEIGKALVGRSTTHSEYHKLLDRARSLNDDGMAAYIDLAKQLSAPIIGASTRAEQTEVTVETSSHSLPSLASNVLDLSKEQAAPDEPLHFEPAKDAQVPSPEKDLPIRAQTRPATEPMPGPNMDEDQDQLNPIAASIYNLSHDESAVDIAERILRSGDLNRWENASNLVWRLIYEDKLDLAFNISRLAEPSVVTAPRLIPHWLIAPMIIGRYVLSNDGKISAELQDSFKEFKSNEIFLKDEKEWNQAIRLLAASAALRAALIAPNSDAPRVLKELEFSGLEHLFHYCRFIGNLEEQAQVLDLETLNRIKDYFSWKTSLDTLRLEVRKWEEDGGKQHIGYEPALRVWRHWIREGLIHELLAPIASGIFDRDSAFAERVERLSSEKAIMHEVDITDRIDLGRSTSFRRIDTKHPKARKLIDLAFQALDFAQCWVDLQKTRPYQTQSYEDRQNEKLGAEVLREREAIIEELDRFEKSTLSLPILAGIMQCRRTLCDVWSLFDPQFPLPSSEPDPALLLYGNLLRVPSLHLDDDWEGDTDDPKQLLTQLLQLVAASDSTWGKAFESKRGIGDHVATGRILSYLQMYPEADPSLDVAKLSSVRDKSIREWREAIERRIQIANQKVGRAALNDWLTEDQSDNYLKEIERIGDSARETLRFSGMLNELDETLKAVSSRLENERAYIAQRLQEKKITEQIPGYAYIRSAIERGEFRLVNEYIDTISEGGKLPEERTHQDHLRAFFPDFVNDYCSNPKKPDEIIRSVKNRRQVCELNFGALTKEQADEAAELLQTWFGIRQKGTIVSADIEKILRHLGFEDPRVVLGDHYPKRRWLDANSRHIRNKNICPVPAFGSSSRGRYRILCVLDEPMEEELFNAVGDTPQQPVIVFYFGRIKSDERREIARLCRADSGAHTFLVIDDALMVYLCSQTDRRLPVLFDCALPFTWLEPYVASGLVPVETFYGRKAEKASIMSPAGAFFIYGGKRLGKTALLYEVVDKFHKPEIKQIAILIDLKERGIGYNLPIDHLWRVLAERLQDEESGMKDLKILPPQMTTNASEETLLGHIETWLKGEDARRILLLLDEADNFLEQDGKEKNRHGEAAEYIRVHRLMKLWERTQGRFKVVFVGLHNVLRTTKVAGKVNPSIGQFGEEENVSKSIGPLIGSEREEAFGLIEAPLYSLGYRFQSPDLVLSILSQTNWYPSLIQLYCHELLKLLKHDPKTSPPYIITSKHIDNAYADLSHQLKDRFTQTLLLDPRYWVIAYSIAHRLILERKTNPAASLTVEEIQQEALRWWAEGFRAAESLTEDWFRILLDEMIRLGVVRTDGDGRYTLRSVNVFSILGNEKEIESALQRKLDMPLTYEASVFRSAYPGHGVNSANTWRRSPLTAQQVSDLQTYKNGASIIFGCRAAGLDYLNEFGELAFGNAYFVPITWATDEKTFNEELRAKLARRETQGVTLFEVGSASGWDHNWVAESLKQLNALTSTKSWARVIFVADPQKTWDLINNSGTHLLAMGTQGLTHFSLTAWQDATVSQWFEECFDFQITDDDRDLIKEVSGNWPVLLGKLYEIEQSVQNWKETINRFVEIPDDLNYALFLGGVFGLDTNGPTEILRELLKSGPVTTERLTSQCGMAAGLVSNSLRWAQVLALCTPGEALSWQVDPVVREVLKHTQSA